MMLPILISVSVAPMSYFFCAKEGLLVTASSARAAEKAPTRSWIAGILDLPGSLLIVCVLKIGRFAARCPALNTFHRSRATKSPLREVAGGSFFSRTSRADDRNAEY